MHFRQGVKQEISGVFLKKVQNIRNYKKQTKALNGR